MAEIIELELKNIDSAIKITVRPFEVERHFFLYVRY